MGVVCWNSGDVFDMPGRKLGRVSKKDKRVSHSSNTRR